MQLRTWLERSRTSKKDLAAQIGIRRPYLSQILHGDRRPSLETLERIERVTGVPIKSWTDTHASDLADSTGTLSKNANVCKEDRGVAVG